MEKESKEGRENGGENDTNDTKEEENTADNEVADKCGVELDTGNGVAPIVDEDIETDSCQGPEAVSGAKITSEKPSGTVPSKSGSAQPKTDPEFQEKTRGEDTKAEVKGPIDEALRKTDQTKASKSEEQSDPDSSQGIEEPNDKTRKAPTAQNIVRDKMGDLSSNGTQEALPGSGVPGAGPDPNNEDAPRKGSGKTDEGESNEPQIAGSSSETKDTKPETVLPGAEPDPQTEGPTPERSAKTDKEKEREPHKTDSSSKPNETNPKTALPGAGPHTEGPTPERSAKTVKEERGGPQITDSSFELKEPKPKTVPPGAGPHAERATPERSGKTDEEKEREQQKTDSSSKPNKTNPKTVELKAGVTVEDIIKERPISISVCTSAYDFNVQGLVSFLEGLKKHLPELINEVKVHALPYNDLDHYKFPKENPVDVMLLCHSINNRRFAITDVMDALYDEYLPYCASVVGKNKMGVIVHDFEDMRETVQSSRMGSFRYKQPKAFETTSLQIICGHIEKKEQVLEQMQKVDREKLLEFLKNASKYPEEMMADPSLLKKYGGKAYSTVKSLWESVRSGERSQESTSVGSSLDPSEDDGNDHDTIRNAKAQDDKTKRSANERQSPPQPSKRACTKNGTSGGSHQTHQTGVDEGNLNPSRDKLPMGQQRPGISNLAAAAPTLSLSSPRRISISVCSSAIEKNVKGFISKLTELQTRQPHMIADVRFRSLPYNDIDSFKFPSNDPVDVMVLCHSIQNRGFSITNVLGALYKKHLEYCRDLIGKKKLAVIVHDFTDCKPKTHDVRMDSFRRSQPLTFELVDTVIVCGSLEVPGKIEMRDEDDTLLTLFFEKARFEPKANNADKK